ncbi:MAG: flagellar basal-body rod protein FlgG [Thermoanaerobacteraceae bacterium]|nr:flagellar basal-body rod protein FlgG [Thermoanaerobacteraceae bacterium]
MIRAMWTAASGMQAQQLNVDTISNNLANVNTTAYKKERVEFKDLLYQELAYDEGRPVNLLVGHGVKPSATVKDFSGGNLQETDNPLDLAIDGEGFFTVLGPNGRELYTRDGSFKLSVDGDTVMLTTSEGYPVLDSGGAEIYFDSNQKDISVSKLGIISVKNEDGTSEETTRIGTAKFLNPQGLEAIGDNLYASTVASGEPIYEDETNTTSNILQGFLETSNVQVVQEMVNLITAQRAYEVNSKSIQTADEMLNITNNLKR